MAPSAALLRHPSARMRALRRRLRRVVGAAAFRLARRHPRTYALSTMLLLVTGYLYLSAPAALAAWALADVGTGVAAGNVASLLFPAALAGLGVTLTVCWWRRGPPPPQGEEIGPADAPALFQLLDALREHYPRRLAGRVHIHRVVIAPQAELRLERVPRFGFPVGLRTTLLIGMPTLQTLKPIQLQALLAGQVAMLAGRGGGSLSWLRDTQCLWSRAAQAEWVHPAPARWALQAWFKPLATAGALWCAPALRRYTLAADQSALQAISYEDVTEAVLAQAIAARFLKDRFWPAVARLGDAAARPRHLPYASLASVYGAVVDDEQRQRWLQRALRAPSGRGEPSLCERLQNLHAVARLPTPMERSAARQYLGDAEAPAIASLDGAWLQRNLKRSRQREAQRLRAHEELQQLQRAAAERRLSDVELQRYVALVNRYAGRAAAGRMLKSALEWGANDARLQLLIGRCLLERGDSNAVAALERAMELDEALTVPACRLISRLRQNAQVA